MERDDWPHALDYRAGEPDQRKQKSDTLMIEEIRIPLELATRVELARRALARRKALNISRNKIAGLIGVSLPTLLVWERGEIPHKLSVQKLAAWEGALAVPMGWLTSSLEEAVPLPTAAPVVVEIPAQTFADAIRMIAGIVSTREWNPNWVSLPRGERAERAIQMFTGRYGVHPEGDRTLVDLEGVMNFRPDLVPWRDEKTQALPNGCIG